MSNPVGANKMDEQVEYQVRKALAKQAALASSSSSSPSPNHRLLIAISGIPGSGKSTLAAHVVARLNEEHNASLPSSTISSSTSPSTTSTPPTNDEDKHQPPPPSSPFAVLVPMDGFHLPRSALSNMPDPAHAHYQRGAPWTFDGAAFAALVRACREQQQSSSSSSSCSPPLPLFAPSFDHAIKDPVADDIEIGAGVWVVVFEGNYLSMDEEPWRGAAAVMDERWWVECEDEGVARGRLVRRHVESGICRGEGEALERVVGTDEVNGREARAKRGEVDEVVVSVEERK